MVDSPLLPLPRPLSSIRGLVYYLQHLTGVKVPLPRGVSRYEIKLTRGQEKNGGLTRVEQGTNQYV